jgi:histidyl-tRNA synthetase
VPTADLAPILADLEARGLSAYVEVDYAIVRGLAYYTGVVFEVFDRAKSERALAGGGRYDSLLSLMSDGKVSLPALGFGMGDVVLANLINENPTAKARMDAWAAARQACDVYVVVAKEELRPEALRLVQELRDSGLRVDYPLISAKVGKQFQAAEHAGARTAVLLGEEWPSVKVKTLATREEQLVARDAVLEALRK